MYQYFKEGDYLSWKGDGDFPGEGLVLRMLRENSRSGTKQTMVAEDIRSGRKYFLKILFCEDLDRLFVEKESKVKLYSPYIVRIYGGMLDVDGRRFITLVEYIDVPDLSDLMRRRETTGETWQEKLRICDRIAMKFLYGIRHYMSCYENDPIIHRDLKPENVMAARDGSVVKIIDFDWVHLHDSMITCTLRREQKGTPGYADPGCWNSYVCRPEMDIYSAGLVLYFIYTGKHHFFGAEEINRYMEDADYACTLKEMPGFDPALTRILQKMIAPEQVRYHDIETVIKDMEDYLKEEGRFPDFPELLTTGHDGDTIRLTYRVGDIKYSPYVRNYRFVPICFGSRQERSMNGPHSAHILSFYRVGDQIRVLLLHKDCRIVRRQREHVVTEGDKYLYHDTEIEVIQIRGKEIG